MMSYEMFCEMVKEKFVEFLPQKYRNGVTDIRKIHKVNRTVDGISVRMEGESRISPTFYLDDMYKLYQQSNDLDKTLSYYAVQYTIAERKSGEIDQNIDMDNLKDNVVMCLVNTEQNKEMLKAYPSREFQDLSVIYRWVLSSDPTGLKSTLVDNDLMQQAGMTEEELFRHASENTKRILPVQITPLQDVIMNSPMMKEMMEEMPPEMMEELIEAFKPQNTLWVITNEQGINGAASMLYESELHKLAEQIGTDLFILPSSCHEVMAASVEMDTAENFAELVQEANFSSCELADRLSNNVYHYDKDLRKLTMATDVPNKRLDGMVSEPTLIYDTGIKR